MKFLAEEKKLLDPLPVDKFELKSYKELKVAQNNHIYLSENKHYYSVPHELIGSTVKVIYTRGMVYIFSKGKQVAVHIRNYREGGYTSDPGHLCSQHNQYRDRSPDYYKQQAKKKSPVLHQLITQIVTQNRYPEQLYRTCEGIFGLYRIAEEGRFEKACQMAIDHQNCTYTFIKNILENKMTEQESVFPDKPLPRHDNLKGKEHYQKTIEQLKINYNEPD